jgi:hypothetical protein
MDDDATLSMAYFSALRSAVVPMISYDGKFSAVKRSYLDSKVLERELTARLRTKQMPQQKDVRNIPIFLFSLDTDLPVFIDKVHQARALSTMVIAAQSNYHLWETPLQCNNRPIYWNLRNPLKALVRETAHALGGLLPLHVTHSHAHNRDSEFWAWSVGDSPLSSTSNGVRFSDIQKDALHRNYVVNAIRRASSIVNRSIVRLRQIETTSSNRALEFIIAGADADTISVPDDAAPNSVSTNNHRPLIEKDEEADKLIERYNGLGHRKWVGQPELELARQAYKSVRIRIHQLRKRIGELQFDKAANALHALMINAKQFEQLTNLITEASSKLECENGGGASAYSFLQRSIEMIKSSSHSLRSLHPYLSGAAPSTSSSSSFHQSSSSSWRHSMSSGRLKAHHAQAKGVDENKLSVLGDNYWSFGMVVILVMLIVRICKGDKAKPKVN